MILAWLLACTMVIDYPPPTWGWESGDTGTTTSSTTS